jgi:hypothetical protein
MGNWHCISSSCATVHYREYLGGKIRWRYGSEAWQEIVGDDYTIVTKFSDFKGGQCPEERYQAYCSIGNQRLVGTQLNGKITSIECYKFPGNFYLNRTYYIRLTNHLGQQSSFSLITANYEGNFSKELIPLYKLPGCKDEDLKECTFKVFKNGQVVYTETRAVCPEVQKIPCQLSTIEKQIEIEKIPYLDRVEVVDYAYDVRLSLLVDSSNYGFLVEKKPIPSQCLNIYNNSITSTIPTNVANTPENLYLQIAQICSAPGCPPPEYQVICDCNNCESCPDGTCVVECEGQICCYGSDGVSVKSIALENYCGGQS